MYYLMVLKRQRKYQREDNTMQFFSTSSNSCPAGKKQVRILLTAPGKEKLGPFNTHRNFAESKSLKWA